MFTSSKDDWLEEVCSYCEKYAPEWYSARLRSQLGRLPKETLTAIAYAFRACDQRRENE